MPGLRFGSRGRAVRELQEALIKLGYALPKWGADGSLGFETFSALGDFAFDHGMGEPREDAAVPPQLVDRLLELASAPRRRGPREVELIDATGDHPGRKRKGNRAWGQINGIVLHQTGCMLSSRVRRWHAVAAHFGIPKTRDPKIIYMNPMTTIMWHANSFNKRTVGIEISGNFEGVDGKPRTCWKGGGGPHRSTDAQLEAARRCVKWICEEVARHGGEVRHIYAHRQASRTRRADPGSRVWIEAGLWSKAELGLDDGGPGYTEGSGLPIPREWDPERTDRY